MSRENAAVQNEASSPILRWAGGKSRLLPRLMPLLPVSYSRFIDPMVGGGALFLYLRPRHSILGDINLELMSFYRALRTHPDRLIRRMTSLRASRDMYYRMRTLRTRDTVTRAVRFAYLNRLCWNGLYRVNRMGNFNVPIGSRLPRMLWDHQTLRATSRALRQAKLHVGDFGKMLQLVRPKDFVFLDPPYPRGAHDGLGFNRYTATTFGMTEHRRLGQWASELATRGAFVMIVLAARRKLLAAYPAQFRRRLLTTRSLISCNSSSRRRVREIVLRNF